MENNFSRDEAREVSETLGLEEPQDLWDISSDDSALKKKLSSIDVWTKFVQYLHDIKILS